MKPRSTTYRCMMRTARRFAPVSMYRMLRDMLRPSVRIMVEPTCCVCSVCDQVLTNDLLEVSGHVAWTHGRQSFILEEVTDDGSEPGDD